MLFNGITAHYLLNSTFDVGPGKKVLIYGVAGGVGDIKARRAKHGGVFVIGVVSRPRSIHKAQAAGCNEVFAFDAKQLPDQVSQATRGQVASWRPFSQDRPIYSPPLYRRSYFHH